MSYMHVSRHVSHDTYEGIMSQMLADMPEVVKRNVTYECYV